MRARAPWPQMLAATALVSLAPAVLVGMLSEVGIVTSFWIGLALAVLFSLAATAAGTAYWRRRTTGDVLFSDLLLWGWLRRRWLERRLVHADALLTQTGGEEPAHRAALLSELGGALEAQDPYLSGHSRRVGRYATMIARHIGLE